jgi:hypothetical protein
MVVHSVLIHEQHYHHITQPNPSMTSCHTNTNLASACYSRPLQLCPLRNIYISKIINVCQTISHQTICPVHQVLWSKASLQQVSHQTICPGHQVLCSRASLQLVSHTKPVTAPGPIVCHPALTSRPPCSCVPCACHHCIVISYQDNSSADNNPLPRPQPQPATPGPCSYASWEIIILAKLPINAKLYLTRQSAQYTMYLAPEPRSCRYLIPVYSQRLASVCCPDISLLHSACQYCIEPDLVGQFVTQTPVHRTDISLLPNAPPAMPLEKNTF